MRTSFKAWGVRFRVQRFGFSFVVVLALVFLFREYEYNYHEILLVITFYAQNSLIVIVLMTIVLTFLMTGVMSITVAVYSSNDATVSFQDDDECAHYHGYYRCCLICHG